ncbi:MAG: response regulator transcription factor [Mycobacterium sp.]
MRPTIEGGEHSQQGGPPVEAAWPNRKRLIGAVTRSGGQAHHRKDHVSPIPRAASTSLRVGNPPMPPNDTAAAQLRSTPRSAPLAGLTDRSGQIPKVRTLIFNDCTLHRENLAGIIAAYGADMATVAWDSVSLSESLSEAHPDIVLLNLVTQDDMALLQMIRQKSPHARVIVVGISDEDESTIIACAEAGVAGYHLRSESLDDLIELMSKVVDGQSVCSPGVSAILMKRLSALAAQPRPADKELVLTSREVQILRMLELGLSNREIADRLCIALHTVKNHVHRVLSKLGVSTRQQAAALSQSIRTDDNGMSYLGTGPVGK